MQTEEEITEVDGGVVRDDSQFCYLGDILDTEGGVKRPVIGRVAGAWRK